MECTYCNAELIYNCEWGLLAAHQSGEVFGEIYQCPNSDGFDTLDESKEYCECLLQEGHKFGSKHRAEEVVCESGIHNGHFYTDRNGDLNEGYPC